MTQKEITIRMAGGLEARQVALLVQSASQFESSVYVETGSKHVNAKSIMGMMSLAMAGGEKMTVITDGPDEEQALSEIEALLESEK